MSREARQQNSTLYPLTWFMVDSADHVSGKTGLTPTVTLSKAGGSFASPAGAVSEVGSGWYKLAGHATDRNTLGTLDLHATGTGADPVDVPFAVVAYDPIGDAVRGTGGTALPNAAANASGGLYTLGGTGVTVVTNNDKLGYTANAFSGTAATTTSATLQYVSPMAAAASGTGDGTTFGLSTITPDRTVPIGSWVLFTSGTNSGLFAQVTGFNPTGAGAGDVTVTAGIFGVPGGGDTVRVLLGTTDPSVLGFTNTHVGRIDAAVSSRMATFTLPTNFASQTISAAGGVKLAAGVTHGGASTTLSLARLEVQASSNDPVVWIENTGNGDAINVLGGEDGVRINAGPDGNAVTLQSNNAGLFIFAGTGVYTLGIGANSDAVSLNPTGTGKGITTTGASVFTGGITTNVTGNLSGSVGSVTAMVTANVVQISGDSTAADNLESYTDGTTPMPVNLTHVAGTAYASSNAGLADTRFLGMIELDGAAYIYNVESLANAPAGEGGGGGGDEFTVQGDSITVRDQ